jgi:hypothetical protein
MMDDPVEAHPAFNVPRHRSNRIASRCRSCRQILLPDVFEELVDFRLELLVENGLFEILCGFEARKLLE